MIIRSCWPVLLRQLSSSIFSSVCLSRLLTRSCCVVSPFVGCRQRNYFFSFLCGSFFTSPSLNPLSYPFSAQCIGKPHYFYPPSALVLAFSRLPSCSRSIKPDRTSTLPQDLNLLCDLNFSEIVLSTAVNIIEDFQNKHHGTLNNIRHD